MHLSGSEDSKGLGERVGGTAASNAPQAANTRNMAVTMAVTSINDNSARIILRPSMSDLDKLFRTC